MGRPRAKKVAIDDASRGPLSNTESREISVSKSTTSEAITKVADPVTLAAETPAVGVVSNELPAAEPKQISDSWVPLFDSLEQPDGTNVAGESECLDPSMEGSMEFLSEESPMGFDEMAMLAEMPSFLDDLSSSLDSHCSMPTLPIGLLVHQESMPLSWSAANAKANANTIPLSQQESTPVSGTCQCQHSKNPIKEDPKSAPNNTDSQSQLLQFSTAFSQAAECYSLEATTADTPSDASQSSDTSSFCESNYEISWHRAPAEQRPGHCDCAASISQRISMLKAEQRNSSPMPIDSVLMLEKEVEESLALLYQCKNCCLDGVTHLLALISVRMTLEILQKTARSEFVAKAKASPAGLDNDTALCIGSFQVPSRARYRFLRKVLQARFHKLAGLIEERGKFIAEDKQDCFLKSATLLMGDISRSLRTILGWVELWNAKQSSL